jgi:deoxycitidine kinase/deoxyguanosine kinase
MAPIILSVEGNIGSGKSSILNFLEINNKDNDIVFLKEPVDKWSNVKDENGITILENFYSDANKHAFMFQIMAFATRMQILKDTIEQNPRVKIIICERSILADKNVFASMLHDDNLIDKMGITIYNTMADNYFKDFPLNGVIYIDAEPDICSSRIKKRSRDGESNIELEYLKKCKDYHDKWLFNYRKYSRGPPETTSDTTLLHIKTNEDSNFDNSDISKNWYLEIQRYIYSFL